MAAQRANVAKSIPQKLAKRCFTVKQRGPGPETLCRRVGAGGLGVQTPQVTP